MDTLSCHETLILPSLNCHTAKLSCATMNKEVKTKKRGSLVDFGKIKEKRKQRYFETISGNNKNVEEKKTA